MAKNPTMKVIVRKALWARFSARVCFLPRFNATMGENRDCSTRSRVSLVNEESVDTFLLTLKRFLLYAFYKFLQTPLCLKMDLIFLAPD